MQTYLNDEVLFSPALAKLTSLATLSCEVSGQTEPHTRCGVSRDAGVTSTKGHHRATGRNVQDWKLERLSQQTKYQHSHE